MKRRKARENAFIAMFELGFGGELEAVLEYGRSDEAGEYRVDEFGEGLLRAYAANAAQIDTAISGRLKGWKASRVPRVSMAILRLSTAEMLFAHEGKDMDSVVINEAVELAKQYGDDGDHQFVNGVLGRISREKAGTPDTPPAEE